MNGANDRGRLVLAGLAATVGAVLLAAGLAAAAAPRPGDYFSLGIQQASADADGTVHLAMSATNAKAEAVDGTLSVRPAGGAAGQALWVAQLRAERGSSGTIDVVIARACGRRLTATFASEGLERSLLVLVPCANVGQQP